MTREEAIEIIKQDIPCEHDTDLIEALEMAVKALEQEPCDKCEVGNPCLYCKHEFEPQESENKEMTREEAIKMLKSKMDGHTDTSYEWAETVRMAIKALEQEKADKTTDHPEWIDYQDGQWIYAKCPVCGSVRNTKTPFCPICGTKMGE